MDIQLRGNKECPFSGVTKSGRVWKNVPESVVYDILPSTTAVFSYAVGSRKVSANEQFFVGAQTVLKQ